QLVAWVQDYTGNKEVYQAVMFEASLADVLDMETVTDAVYPNPSNGSFNLNLGEGQWNVDVYDITGRKVYENRHEGQSAIDLGQCPKGMYFLKAKNGGEEVMAKVVVR
ncbi:MAG: T9SS type A sorting domain-containing protein, partial [Bacteroidales bacterium]|nr:T9SS type A sorting domain-containing protein [Bacteroidales bacterium]MBR6227542.1 T9SS type A sorting domain-containing protein [Bacteroidales bacterium]